MFATSSRYSTACAGAPARSKAREPTTAVTNTRRDLAMKPPDRRRCAACHSMPPPPVTRDGKTVLGQFASPYFVLGRQQRSTYTHVRLALLASSGLVWLAT